MSTNRIPSHRGVYDLLGNKEFQNIVFLENIYYLLKLAEENSSKI